MKKIILLCLTASLLIGWATLAPADDAAAPDTAPASCPVMGAAREVGLLVFGIGWEAVRVVLPDWCPAKQKDIDGLLSGIPADREVSP